VPLFPRVARLFVIAAAVPFGVNALTFILARTWGLTTPFWIAAAVMALIAVAAWRPLRQASAASRSRRVPPGRAPTRRAEPALAAMRSALGAH